MIVTSDSIASDLERLNIRQGDVLLLRANLGSIGVPKGVKSQREASDLVLEFILRALGPSGTLVSLAYTGTPWFWSRRGYVFEANSESNSGALPNAMLRNANSLRSRHPSNSVVAIGPESAAITEGHDQNAPAYEPIRKLIELDAKMALIGIVNSSPGFTTTHLAEFDLGHHRRLIFPTLNCVHYKDADGVVRLFRRTDHGLCAKSFGKFYAPYTAKGILVSGRVGQADAIMVPARAAYEIDLAVLRVNPRFNICDNPDCFTCNGRRWDRLHHLPAFILRRVWRALKKAS